MQNERQKAPILNIFSGQFHAYRFGKYVQKYVQLHFSVFGSDLISFSLGVVILFDRIQDDEVFASIDVSAFGSDRKFNVI